MPAIPFQPLVISVTFAQGKPTGVVRRIPHRDPLNRADPGQIAGKKKAGTEGRLGSRGSRLLGQVVEEAFHPFEEAFGFRLVSLGGGTAEGLVQLAQQIFLGLGQLDRGLDHHLAHQIPHLAGAHGLDALAPQAEQLAGLRFRRDLELDPAIQGRHFDLAAELKLMGTSQ